MTLPKLYGLTVIGDKEIDCRIFEDWTLRLKVPEKEGMTLWHCACSHIDLSAPRLNDYESN